MNRHPEEILPSIERATTLFHSKEYFNLQKTSASKIISDETSYLVGHSQNDTFYSPQKAPFGGEVIIGNSTSFYHAVTKQLKDSSIQNLVIRYAPECYNAPSHPYTFGTLETTNNIKDLNYHITIDGSSFVNLIHENQRGKINNCLEQGFYCTEISLKRAYQFIATALHEKDISMTMQLDELEEAKKQLPYTYEAYGVLDGQSIVAAAILVRVNKKVSYLAYNAHDKAYNNISPLVFLYEHVYALLREKHFKIFDLGVCSVNGIVNEGLQKFKERMGATRSSRHTITYRVH